jgi:(p)ppGpp synthase/HD superfamily hydrolase
MEPRLSSRFDSALDMAACLHRYQVRKGSGAAATPYLAHLLTVTAIVLEDDPSEDLAIAALLHDGPEDHGGLRTLKLIEDQFGPRVAEIVRECSDTFRVPKPNWLIRKRRFLAKLRKVKDRGVLLVKCADCLANARSTLWDHRLLGTDVWNRFKSMPCATNQVWWHASCVQALQRIDNTRAFPQLEEVVTLLMKEVEPCKRTTSVHARHQALRPLKPFR